MNDLTPRRIALVGGRGYTGSELLSLLAVHPGMDLAFASSSSQAGLPLSSACPEWPDPTAVFVALNPSELDKHPADAWVLAVPNGAAEEWAGAIRMVNPDAIILDLSADHRFDQAWIYGLPERFRDLISTAKQIANPGCYATGIQLALLPVLKDISGIPTVFGVSGYSGAGRTRSPRNDLERLRDNLVPYSLNGHVHEQEASSQLGFDVRFIPHVAPFFRGITLTISASLGAATTADDLFGIYDSAYSDEVRVRVNRDIPEVTAVRGLPDVHIGGFSVDQRDASRITLVAVLDNLSKGAASQAMQNLNLALGMDENQGIDHE